MENSQPPPLVLHYDWMELENCLFVVFPLKSSCYPYLQDIVGVSPAISLISVFQNKFLTCSNLVFHGGLFLYSRTLTKRGMLFTVEM